MEIAIWIAAAVVALGAFVALAAHLGRRTWSDEEFERERRGGTALGNAILATQAALEPGAGSGRRGVTFGSVASPRMEVSLPRSGDPRLGPALALRARPAQPLGR